MKKTALKAKNIQPDGGETGPQKPSPMDLLQIVRWFHLLPEINLWSPEERDSERFSEGHPFGMPRTIDSEIRSALKDAGHIYWLSKVAADTTVLGDPWNPTPLHREAELLMAIRDVWFAAVRWTPDATKETMGTGGLARMSIEEAARQTGRKTATSLLKVFHAAGLRVPSNTSADSKMITSGQLHLFQAYEKRYNQEKAREKKRRDRASKKSPGTPPKPLILDFGGCGPKTELRDYLDAAQRVLDRLKWAAQSIGLDLPKVIF